MIGATARDDPYLAQRVPRVKKKRLKATSEDNSDRQIVASIIERLNLLYVALVVGGNSGITEKISDYHK